jgi:hypothetical protein
LARKIYYWVKDCVDNIVSDEEWEEVLKIQHWYNSEFFWTAGKLDFKMFSAFPNWKFSSDHAAKVVDIIRQRKKVLKQSGLKENQIIKVLESEGSLIVKKGGYQDGCIASGFTRMASNEYNAYLVCEFLLKVSKIVAQARIDVKDEGKFIKTHSISFQNGNIIMHQQDENNNYHTKELNERRKIFSIVNPVKYDDYSKFTNQIENYSKLKKTEKLKILHDWNWLGFEDNYDYNGDDIEGLNLNLKVNEFIVE